MGTATYNGRIFAKLLTTEMTKFQLTLRPAHTCVTSISKLAIMSPDDGLRIPALGFQQSHQCIEHVYISQIARVWSRVIHCFIACLSVCHPRCVLLSTMETFPVIIALGVMKSLREKVSKQFANINYKTHLATFGFFGSTL